MSELLESNTKSREETNRLLEQRTEEAKNLLRRHEELREETKAQLANLQVKTEELQTLMEESRDGSSTDSHAQAPAD